MFVNSDNRDAALRLASWVTLFVLLVATIVSLGELKNLKVAYELTGFLSKNDQALADDAGIKKRFRLGESPWMMIVAKRSDTWLSSSALQDLKLASSQLKEIAGIKSVTSLATLETVVRADQDLQLGNLSDVLNQAEWQKFSEQNAVASPTLVSKDGKWISILIELEDRQKSSADNTPVDFETVRRQSLATVGSMKDVSSVKVTGVSVIQAEMSEKLLTELQTLGGLGIGLSILALFVLFSGFTGVFIALGTCAVANILVLAAMAHFEKSLGILSLSLPIVIAVQALSLTVHCLFTYIEVRLGMSRMNALVTSFRRLMFPNFVVSVATGLGFLTLAGSEVDAMREFGVTVALASLALWLTTTLATFPLLALLPEPKLRPWVGGKAKWVLWIMKNRSPVLLGFAILGVFTLSTGLQLNFSHRLFNEFGPTSDVTLATESVDRNLGGLVPLEVELMTNDGEAWTELHNRQRLEDTMIAVRKLPIVGSAVSAVDLIQLGQVKGAEYGEVLTLFEIAPKNPLKNFLRDDGTRTRISLRLKDFESRKFESDVATLMATIQKISGANPQRTVVGGWGSYIHKMNQKLSKNLVQGFWEALLAISVVLALVFRSLRWSIAAVIPSVLPPLLLVGALSVLQIEVKPGLAVVFAIALGFAFINSIYLLKRVRETAMQEANGVVTAKVVEHAFWRESQSCLLASLTLIIGFASLCFSDFHVARSFGMAMVFSMLAGVVGDLVLLPALLRKYPHLLNANTSSTFLIPTPQSGFGRVAVIVFLFLASVTTPARASGMESLEDFARAASKSLFAKDESVEIELKNIESDGEEEVRRIELSRMTVKKGNKVEQRIVAKILSPKSLRGTSVLTVTDGESQSRWIYLPSSKQVRRVVGGDESSAPILGSELSTEDLDLSQVDGAKAKIVQRNGGVVTIESKIASKESAYSGCKAEFDEKTRLMKNAQCMDRGGQPFKRIAVKSYRNLKGGIARPTEMEVVNLKTKRMTRITFMEQKINSGLKSSQFTPEALRD